MEVELVTMTPNPERIVYMAAKRCVSPCDGSDRLEVMDEASWPATRQSNNVDGFILRVAKRGHLSILEHVQFTYHIKGISRACSHQLVRHRLASYSQMSQRHVTMGEGSYVVPQTVIGVPALEDAYRKDMAAIYDIYKKWVGLIPKEDARYFLPEGTTTALVMTVNARELIHIAEERLCSRAQWEIFSVVKAMCQEASSAFPVLEHLLGPKCAHLGYCPEDVQCARFGSLLASQLWED